MAKQLKIRDFGRCHGNFVTRRAQYFLLGLAEKQAKHHLCGDGRLHRSSLVVFADAFSISFSKYGINKK